MKNIGVKFPRNTLVLAENNGNKNGFNIFLVFSGQREILITHRHNGLLYSLLADGIRLDHLNRLKPSSEICSYGGRRRKYKKQAAVLKKSVNRLLFLIRDYLHARNRMSENGNGHAEKTA